MTVDAWGIEDGWTDVHGRRQTASPDTIAAIREAMGDPSQGRPATVLPQGRGGALDGPALLRLEGESEPGEVEALPADLPIGTHELDPTDGSPGTHLIVSPGRCHLPADLRAWGATVQVPTARSRTSWGIGDLADVRLLAQWLHGLGAGTVALSPLHAPTPTPPISRSPYYPSSRRWRSPLLIRVDEVEGASAVGGLGAVAAQARSLLDSELVDRDACWALQRTALERIWAASERAGLPGLAAWRAEQGAALESWALFCALAEGHGADWRTWPAELRHPSGPAVGRTAGELEDRIAFHCWLQLLVDRQLERARSVGPRIVQDLAIGADPGGADSWIWQELQAGGFSIGAPPDEFVPEGQSWGLPPWIPWRLRDRGYRPLSGLLRAALVEGGGLRIDHVMGLKRVFWVPEGASAAEGAYVRFHGRELLHVVAIESVRAGAIVIGEDLGTVEEGFRDELRDMGILSTRLLWFEDRPPEAWPAQSLAMIGTHDLPTLAGMCSGADSPAAMRDRLQAVVDSSELQRYAAVTEVVHARLGAAPAMLALASLEDLLGVTERPNLPGSTDDQRPNWSRALPVPIEDLGDRPETLAALRGLAAGRGNPPEPLGARGGI